MPWCATVRARSSAASSGSWAASNSGTTSTSVSTEREEGEETSKYMETMQFWACYDYDAVQGCLKMHLGHFSYFRISAGFINRSVCTIHLPESGSELRVLLRRGFRHRNRRHDQICLVVLINFHFLSFSI